MGRLQQIDQYVPASQGILVDYAKPLRDILSSRNVNPFNGRITSEVDFPPQSERGIVRVLPSIELFKRDMSVADARASLRSSQDNTPADLWTLANCAHFLSRDGQKIYAFARGVKIDGTVRYPYIGMAGAQRYISLTREDFGVESGCGALICRQVLVR